MRKKLRLFVILTCVHGTVTLGLMAYAVAVGLPRFDHPELDPTFGETAANVATHVLMLPGRLVWTSWASKNLPNVFESLLLIANSAVWATIGVSVTAWIIDRRDRIADVRHHVAREP